MNHGVRHNSEAKGQFLTVDDDLYYRISAYDSMRPFLMSIPSDTDLWMYVSSNGGLTAGRIDAEGSLFPYETVDRLHDGHCHTGPITMLRVRRGGGAFPLWQPLSERSGQDFQIERNLSKNAVGNRLIFEEINRDLDLVFKYRWSGSDEFGLVRTATLENLGSDPVTISLLDGLRNVLPYGAPLSLYQQYSSLVDAYKRTDIDPDTKMATYSLTSQIVDRPEAAEQLRANVVWCSGLEEIDVCLSIDAVGAFRRGEAVRGESVLKGRRGNYLVFSSLELAAGASAKWHIVADVGRGHVELVSLCQRLVEDANIDNAIEGSLAAARENLLRIVGSADGLQLTGHPETANHHLANVLYNNMRGGVFEENCRVSKVDFVEFLTTRNRVVANRRAAFLSQLPAEISSLDLISEVDGTGDADLERLSLEYLPIFFGRRHGDPSRPWNRFSIRVKNPDGSRAFRYEGNWRDIFQNWEPLCMSFPRFLPGIIAKFVNASTVDGFNPYRITRDGIEWEVIDPADPWSYIGYWGDHQIIYLLKFLEALTRFAPDALGALMEREIFSYAAVPYRIKAYEEIIDNPKATITYDTDLASRIEEQVQTIGTDGKLVSVADGSIHHVNLLEKLLVPVLAKLSNFVPGGGIWMNTQRPEWNDANNALVGNGVSMVTLYYLRRYLRFLEKHLDDQKNASISAEVVAWFERLHSVFADRASLLDSGTVGDRDRKQFLDDVGAAFSDYRDAVYSSGFSGRKTVPVLEIVEFCRCARGVLDHAVRANRRDDGLYHSYNLLEVSKDRTEVSVRPLYEMLEGQVAVLSSGAIEPPEAVELLSSLFHSRMYREEQRSFLLYPERKLPGFLEKNVVPPHCLRDVKLLQELIDGGESSVLAQDAAGVFRFHKDFRNASDLSSALDRLAERRLWAKSVKRDRSAVLDVFEKVFSHRTFTGRSGTMYGYEGLGCIYWHMVAKLLLAVQEIVFRAVRDHRPTSVVDALIDYYYRIRGGLGFEKTVSEYGAFPTDPYSHTPPHGGAQQPGMTGQVKEEILTRIGELGVQVENGAVVFRPVLLRQSEFLDDSVTFRYFDMGGSPHSIEVPPGSMAFTFCQVPIIYERCVDKPWILVTDNAGATTTHPGDRLDLQLSSAIFDRDGSISRIDVGIPQHLLRIDQSR